MNIIEKEIVIIVINSNRSRAREKVSLSVFDRFSAVWKGLSKPVFAGFAAIGANHALHGILFLLAALNKTVKVGNSAAGKNILSAFVSKCEWENFSFSQSVGGKRTVYAEMRSFLHTMVVHNPRDFLPVGR